MVLTADYFGADISKLIRILAPAVGAVVASGLLLYMLSVV